MKLRDVTHNCTKFMKISQWTVDIIGTIQLMESIDIV